MRKLLTGIFLALALIANATPITDSLATAFKTGNSSEIAKYFNNSVDLSIPGNEGVYSNTQAKLILKTFYTPEDH